MPSDGRVGLLALDGDGVPKIEQLNMEFMAR